VQQRAKGDNSAMPINALLVHGAGGGAWEWGAWQRVLAVAGVRGHAIELAAVPAGLAGTRLADYAAQVRSVAQALPEPRVIIGASLGGTLAALVADEVAARALVLVNPLLAGAVAPQRTDARDGVVPWSQTSLERTRRAMPDADDATCIHAAARWRDESAAVLDDARALRIARPACPVLVLASERDDDISAEASRALAHDWRADFVLLRGASHVGPLLGRDAARVAELVSAWLHALL